MIQRNSIKQRFLACSFKTRTVELHFNRIYHIFFLFLTRDGTTNITRVVHYGTPTEEERVSCNHALNNTETEILYKLQTEVYTRVGALANAKPLSLGFPLGVFPVRPV